MIIKLVFLMCLKVSQGLVFKNLCHKIRAFICPCHLYIITVTCHESSVVLDQCVAPIMQCVMQIHCHLNITPHSTLYSPCGDIFHVG